MPALSNYGKPKGTSSTGIPSLPVGGPPGAPPPKSAPASSQPPAGNVAPPPTPIPGPPNPGASSPNLFGAIFDAWIQTWKDSFRILWWLLRNPWAAVPLLIVCTIGAIVIFMVQAFLFKWGVIAVAALSLFFYIRSIDRYALKIVQKKHQVPPAPAEPKHLTTMFKLLQRPESPGKPEGEFRHYFFRQAWWDFRVILVEAFRSVSNLSHPFAHWAGSLKHGSMLLRAFAFPIAAMIGIIALISMVFFAGLGMVHLLAFAGLYLASFLYSGKPISSDGADLSAPRRIGGFAVLAGWIIVPLILLAPVFSVQVKTPPPAASTVFQPNNGQQAVLMNTDRSKANAKKPSRTLARDSAVQVNAYTPTAPAPSISSADQTIQPVAVQQPQTLQPPTGKQSHPQRTDAAPVPAAAPPPPSKPARSETAARALPVPPSPSPRNTSTESAAREIAGNEPAPQPRIPDQAAAVPPPPPPALVKTDPLPPAISPNIQAQPAYAGPRSGHLSYAGAPVPQNGEITFSGLPPGNLNLTFDSNNWGARLVPTPDGRQRLVLRSKKPGTQKKAEVMWSLVQ